MQRIETNRGPYADGYAEGRRSAICCVVPLEESVILMAADAVLADPDEWRSTKAYWIGMKRGFRNHYADAYQPTVLAARERRAS